MEQSTFVMKCFPKPSPIFALLLVLVIISFSSALPAQCLTPRPKSNNARTILGRPRFLFNNDNDSNDKNNKRNKNKSRNATTIKPPGIKISANIDLSATRFLQSLGVDKIFIGIGEIFNGIMGNKPKSSGSDDNPSTLYQLKEPETKIPTRVRIVTIYNKGWTWKDYFVIPVRLVFNPFYYFVTSPPLTTLDGNNQTNVL